MFAVFPKQRQKGVLIHWVDRLRGRKIARGQSLKTYPFVEMPTALVVHPHDLRHDTAHAVQRAHMTNQCLEGRQRIRLDHLYFNNEIEKDPILTRLFNMAIFSRHYVDRLIPV